MNSQKTLRALDLRVRERNLRKGTLTEKEVQQHLSELPDVGENAETVSLPQPALSGGGHSSSSGASGASA